MSQLWISRSSVFNSISCRAEQRKRLGQVQDLLFTIVYTIIVGSLPLSVFVRPLYV